MNSAEFENWMKQKVDSEEYVPTAGMWEKLQADLQDKKPKKRILLLMPMVKIAAAVLVLFSAGYFLWPDKAGISLPESKLIATSRMNQSKAADAQETIINDKDEVVSSPATANRPIKFATETTHFYSSDSLGQHDYLNTEPKVAVVGKTDTASRQPALESPEIIYPEPINYAPDNRFQSGSNIGIAAHIGKPGLGTLGYQIGVVGRREISDRLFVEATVALASTAVTADRNYSFTSVNMGADGLTNNFEKETENINARYARNIIALGANPSLGLKLSSNVSVSGGVAVYRNINPSLALKNRGEIGNEALTSAVVNDEQRLSLWDVGFTANADYRVTGKLLFNLHYRRGVTNFYEADNEQYKNSIFNIGIKYMFSGR